MGFFSFLAGKSPEEIEIVGDKFFKSEEFGAAKMEYEKALVRAESKFPEKATLIQKLQKKITDASEALALAHKRNGDRLIESGNIDEAEELLLLALELTQNDGLKNEIQSVLEKVDKPMMPEDSVDPVQLYSGTQPLSEVHENTDPDEYFTVLCHSLPEEIQQTYLEYDREFREGFIALNSGDFETAVEKFTQSLEKADFADSLIPLELSNALMNLEEYDRAREILEEYIQLNDEEIRAYQILCDIYWVKEAFDEAGTLLETAPAEIKDTFPIMILKGETSFQKGEYNQALELFQHCLEKFGENEIITRAQAKTYEAMGELETARDIYGNILNSCTKCGARTDPFIMNQYAELCYACGERSSRLVEVYLALFQQDADNQEAYGQRIYELYEAMGHKQEAVRYRSFVKSN